MSEPDQADRAGPRPRWPGSAREWAVDAAIAVAVIAAEVGGSHAARHVHHHGAPGAWAYVLLAVSGAALLARRRYPVTVLAVTLVTALGAGALGANLIWFAVIVAFFTAVLARQRVVAIASLVIGYLASVWPPWLIGQTGHASVSFALELAAGLVFMLIIAELLRIRSQRGAAVARSREEELRRRASEERMRMARDLHDVVAHNISVINVQANTALHLMDRQPERARSALVTINEVSKQALVELRTVLGVLRDVDAADAPRTPVPGLARSATWSTTRPPPGSRSASSRTGGRRRCPRTSTSPPTGSSRRRSPTPPVTPAGRTRRCGWTTVTTPCWSRSTTTARPGRPTGPRRRATAPGTASRG